MDNETETQTEPEVEEEEEEEVAIEEIQPDAGKCAGRSEGQAGQAGRRLKRSGEGFGAKG